MLRIAGLLAIFVLLAVQIQARVVPAFAEEYGDLIASPDLILSKRYTTTFTAPSGYRVSYGTSTGQYITRSTLSGATSVGQNEVNRCGQLCAANSRCGFYHPVQMSGGSEGAVICALYTTKQAKAAATYNTGAGGTVRYSCGFTKDTTVTTTSTSTTSSRTSTTTSMTSSTSTSTKTTSSSTTSSTATNTFPASPAGATLVQYKPCSSNSNTLPMFVNKKYPITGSSSSSTVWIVQHGAARNFDQYFTSLYNVVGDQGVIISPQFYATSDTPTVSGGKASNWYQPTKNLAWNDNDFNFGADAIGTSCASFDAYDSLINMIRDKSKFPNVSRIFIVAHSGGSNMAARYAMFSTNTDIKYVLANHASMPYFTSARPLPQSGCSGVEDWQYGFSGTLPCYVAARNAGPVSAFRTLAARDAVFMTGTYDTYSRSQSGDQSCQVQAQGGQNRRDRGYAWWAYLNILGGTSRDVAAFFGYDSLIATGATTLSSGSFNLKYCIVDGVAHDQSAMFSSSCGQAAISGSANIPAGPGPVRPA